MKKINYHIFAKQLLMVVCTIICHPIGAQRNLADFIGVSEDSVLVIKPDSVGANVPVLQVPQRTSMTNTIVPTSYNIDTSKDVGEIPCQSTVLPTGAVTIAVPIETANIPRGNIPELSLSYNSMGSVGVLGCGWSVGGLSVISQINKTIYYDGKAEGITVQHSSPAYALDGQRLIQLTSSDTLDTYQTEQGFIKAQRIKYSNGLSSFKVYYPNGSRAEYNKSDGLNYYITKSTDIPGNIISYSYTQQEGHQRISSISYGALGTAKIDFSYMSASSDLTPVLYSAGLKSTYPYLLSSIRTTFNGNEIRKYEMNYQQKGFAYELSSIKSSVDGHELNPLRFYYGNNNNSKQYETEIVYTMPSFDFGTNEKNIYGQRIKFDYRNDNEGVMLFKNAIPYYEEEYATYHRIVNYYSGSSTILVNNNLDQPTATASSITMESGFRDAFSMNVDGMEEEELVKFNNVASETTDSIVFTVYAMAWTGTPAVKYKRSYAWDNVIITGNDRNVSPKECYQGDFNGDGKPDLMVVSANKPMYFNNIPTHCMILDLESDTILYNGTPFEYNLKIPGVFNGTQRTPQQAYNISDKIRITDYDGDGKSEICLINNSGTYFYGFDNDGDSGLSCQQRCFSTYVSTETVKDKTILQGDFNGDGKTDFMLTPKNNYNNWLLFSAKGNGDFDLKTLNINTYTNNLTCIIQDMNLDGQSDVIVKNGATLTTYFIANQTVQSTLSTTIPEHSVIVPTNIHRDYSTYNLVAIDNEWYARKIRIANDDHTNRLLTGMVNSFGVINRYSYCFLDGTDAPYTKGDDASFPYENFVGGLTVCTKSEVFNSGVLYSNQGFHYSNAVIHKQGLGYQGFSNVYISDNVTLDYSDINFDPFRRGVMTRLDNNKITSIYEYELLYGTNKTLKTQLRKEISTDKATGMTSTTTNSYNFYNYISNALTSYSDGTQKNQNVAYMPRVSSSDYYLERIRAVTHTDTRPSGSSIRGDVFIPRSNNMLSYKSYKINNRTTKAEYYTYDGNNQLIKKSIRSYSDTRRLEEEYTYNNLGQLVSKKDPMGLVTSYAYDGKGRLATITYPDGNTSTKTYDVWGRLICEINSDSTRYTSSLQWNSDNTAALYRCSTMKTNAYERFASYDAFNREVQSGESSVVGIAPTMYTEYDYRGRIARVSDPQFFHGTSVWTQYEYDGYDRPVSITYPSGKTDSFSYDGLSTTATTDGITATKTYNALGDLLSSTDPAGTITYSYHRSGQPETITTPGNVVTTISYDDYFRRSSITDPSSGTSTFSYNTRGKLATQTDGNGNSTTYSYDQFDRITSKLHTNAGGNDSLRTNYQYDALGRVLSIQNSNSSGISYSYDNNGRVSECEYRMDDCSYVESRHYDNKGHLSSVDYESQDGSITTENYVYNHEKLVKIYLPEEAGNVWNNLLLSAGNEFASADFMQASSNTGTELRVLPVLQTEQIAYSARSSDVWGNITTLDSGPYNHNRTYDSEGQCTSMMLKKGKSFPTITPQNLNRLSSPTTTYCAENYSYNLTTGNLLSRSDTINNVTESFSYDNLNRLVSSNSGNVGYDAKGNILTKSDAGSYSYLSAHPYAVSGVVPAAGSNITMHDQDITYNCMQRVSHISENGREASFWYDDDGERVKMTRGDGTQTYSKYYLGGRYEITFGPGLYKRQVFYVGGDAYSANVVKVKESDSAPWKKYYICRDRLGSITMILDSLGNAVQNVGYDAWGNLRDPQTHALYTESDMPTLFLERGFTGHEHLPEFGLINMNARLYDPVLGRFLSPDPYVQLPDFSQSYNRYSYCLNNPLKYVDPDGEVWWIPIVVGAAVFGVGNTAAHIIRQNGSWHGWMRNFAQGAIVGGTLVAAWQFAPVIPGIGTGIQTAMSIYGIGKVGLGVADILGGVVHGWSGLERGAKLFLGNFYLDENRFMGGIIQGVSRHTWESLQSTIGEALSLYYNTTGKTDRVDYLGGATFSTMENSSKEQGITIGNYINVWNNGTIKGDFAAYATSNPRYMHEYGHTIDSRLWGPAYIFGIGIPSLWSAKHSYGLNTPPFTTHRMHWMEKRANRRARDYFGKYYGVDWNTKFTYKGTLYEYEQIYPTY